MTWQPFPEKDVDGCGADWSRFSDDDLKTAIREGATKAIRDRARHEMDERTRRLAQRPHELTKPHDLMRKVAQQHPHAYVPRCRQGSLLPEDASHASGEGNRP